jgi:N-acetylglucosamine kinase-like BadF-type ATPase
MPEPRYVLGIDGGATHTRAVVLNDSGERLGGGEGQGCNPLVHGFAAAVERIVEATRKATEQADLGLAYYDAACFGLAGIGRQKDRERVFSMLLKAGLAETFTLGHDAAVALFGATGGKPGVIVIAGTGAIAFGKDAAGKRARADGWGRLMGDEGGGYDLGAHEFFEFYSVYLPLVMRGW